MALTHICTKKFGDDTVTQGEKVRHVGEVVDASLWRNAEKLVRQRWMTVLSPNVETTRDAEGRFWVAAEGEDVPGDPLDIDEFPKHVGKGGPWYVLSSGTKVKGKAKAAEQEAALQSA